jgi:site-specific DNA-methyltransferase (adenine-specific)
MKNRTELNFCIAEGRDIFSQIFLGDCLEVMSEIETGSVDMVLCDLPYGTTRCSWDSVIDLQKLWLQYKRIVKPNGAILLFAQSPFDKVLGVSNLPMLKYEWIWEKTSATGHFNAKKMPLKAHENILVFYKELPTYNFIKTSGHVRKTAYKRQTLNSEVYNANTTDTFYDSTDRYPRSVLKFKSDKQTENLHPTQKPLALCEYFIATYSNEGDTILDNTAGSGTTGLAAKNLKRNSILIEKEYSHFETILMRVGGNTKINALTSL